MIDVLATSVDDVHALADRVAHALPGSGLGAQRLVSDRDRVAAGARLRTEDSRRTLAGRAALRMLVAARTGRPVREAGALAIDRTCSRCGEQHGQPRVEGLSVSSSTSGPYVLVAVGDADALVGVDVEVVPDELWTGFDAYALHPDERASMPEGPDGVSHRIRAWAQKEAVLKAVGLGLRAAPARLRIAAVETPGAWPSGAGMLDPGAWRPVATTQVREAAGSWVTSLDAADDAWWMLAAATPQPIRRWTLDDLAAAHPSAA